jgi:hypothetical protein
MKTRRVEKYGTGVLAPATIKMPGAQKAKPAAEP